MPSSTRNECEACGLDWRDVESIPVSGSFGVSSDVGTSPAASWSITSLPVFFCQSPKREEKEQIGLFLCSRRMLGLLDRGESEKLV